MNLNKEKKEKEVVNIDKIMKFGVQFKFFGSKQVYEMVDSNIKYKKFVSNRLRQKTYVLTEFDKQNIRSVYDPIKNRQIAKRKNKGGQLECFYLKK